MAKVVASTYEILEEIGSGGGGIVYLAWHKRLGKKVVLKADKRKLTAKPETLRREVDTLKNLSHTYIPQVYDFVVEDDTVYTVMDYVEGESIDKPLKRGERFSQAQVVKWARQLLSALSYMHSRQPHGILHADIKPSNVMLTPEGDIRLIDFNISLMLGEEGAVAVGRSYGFASPEHYGLSYNGSGITQNSATSSMQNRKTETQMIEPSSSPSYSDQPKKKIVLDKRSDIYSLGATLYNMLTGRRPEPSAVDVKPITAEEASPQVAEIIMKAMAPDPDKRYQSADEMLWAFEHLWDNDARAKSLTRKKRSTWCIAAVIFVVGAFVAFTGLKQMEQIQHSYALAEQSESALSGGDRSKALALALEALPEKNLFNPEYTPQAQKALADALGLYDLSDGLKTYKTITQATQTTKLAISPDGKTAAAVCKGTVTVFDTGTAKVKAQLPASESGLADVKFTDGDTLVYAGRDGLTAYGISAGKTLWTGSPAVKVAVSADGKTAAGWQNGAISAELYNMDGSKKASIGFGAKTMSSAVNDALGDPDDVLFALNANGSMLAVSFSDGSLTVFSAAGRDGDLEIFDASEFTHFEGGFSGKYFAFSATGGSGSQFAIIDTAAASQTGGFELTSRVGVETDENGIYISNGMTVVSIDPVSGQQTELAYTDSDVKTFSHTDEYTLVLTGNNTYWLFDKTAALITKAGCGAGCQYAAMAGEYAVIGGLDTPDVKLLRIENHGEAQTAAYDPAYKHDELRLNADKNAVMLFSYTGFRLCGMDGKVIKELSLPNSDQIYDQQYRRDDKGSRLEVTYYDGTVASYSGDTGELLSTEKGPAPDRSLAETFYTDKYRIESPLHGAPTVYDAKSGKEVCKLQPDDYLTYATQTGAGIMTQYITEDGEQYGLLLDENCQAMAYLPKLCDFSGDTLYFDIRSGSVRAAQLYSTAELLKMAKQS